jgi:hypothetical protein
MTIAVLASALANGSNVTTVTTSAIDTTGATCLVLFISAGFQVNATPTDSKSNTWTPLWDLANVWRQMAWICESPTVGTGHTFTATWSAGEYPVVIPVAVGGTTAGAALDLSGTGSDGSLPYTITTGTLAQADELILLQSLPSFSSGPSAPRNWNNGFTEVQAEPDYGNYYLSGVGQKIVASSAAQTCGADWESPSTDRMSSIRSSCRWCKRERETSDGWQARNCHL